MNMNDEITQPGYLSVLMQPWVGTLFTTLSALGLMLLGILLPLISKAGTVVSYSAKNTTVFAVALLLTLLCSGAAVAVNMKRRAVDGSPLPLVSLIICSVLVFIFGCFITGLLRV